MRYNAIHYVSIDVDYFPKIAYIFARIDGQLKL